MIKDYRTKKINVKHQHRYTLEKANLYNGLANYQLFDDHEEISYQENDGAKVKVSVFPEYLKIERKADITSSLLFFPYKKTSNELKSEYGNFNVEIYTYKYQKHNHCILVEYDILSSSSQKDGYEIMFEMEENINEFN